MNLFMFVFPFLFPVLLILLFSFLSRPVIRLILEKEEKINRVEMVRLCWRNRRQSWILNHPNDNIYHTEYQTMLRMEIFWTMEYLRLKKNPDEKEIQTFHSLLNQIPDDKTAW